MLAAIAIFPSERNIFFHERSSAGRQSAATFVLAYTALELPMQVWFRVLFKLQTDD
jgi:hypothetical protein